MGNIDLKKKSPLAELPKPVAPKFTEFEKYRPPEKHHPKPEPEDDYKRDERQYAIFIYSVIAISFAIILCLSK